MKFKKLFIAAFIAFNLFANNEYMYCQEPEKVTPPTTEVELSQVLKTNTVEIIAWVKETAQKTENFAAEQTPLYIKEYISWQIWGSLIEIVLFLIPTGLAFWILFTFMKKYKESDDGFLFAVCVFSGIVSLTLFVMSICCTIFNVNLIAKASIAPRVVIVEKVNDLLKTK